MISDRFSIKNLTSGFRNYNAFAKYSDTVVLLHYDKNLGYQLEEDRWLDACSSSYSEVPQILLNQSHQAANLFKELLFQCQIRLQDPGQREAITEALEELQALTKQKPLQPFRERHILKIKEKFGNLGLPPLSKIDSDVSKTTPLLRHSGYASNLAPRCYGAYGKLVASLNEIKEWNPFWLRNNEEYKSKYDAEWFAWDKQCSQDEREETEFYKTKLATEKQEFEQLKKKHGEDPSQTLSVAIQQCKERIDKAKAVYQKLNKANSYNSAHGEQARKTLFYESLIKQSAQELKELKEFEGSTQKFALASSIIINYYAEQIQREEESLLFYFQHKRAHLRRRLEDK